MALKLGSLVGISNGYLVVSSDPTNGTDSEEFFSTLDGAMLQLRGKVLEAEAVIGKAKELAAAPRADIVSPKEFAAQIDRKRGR